MYEKKNTYSNSFLFNFKVMEDVMRHIVILQIIFDYVTCMITISFDRINRQK